jgi:undecaprenyl pyrophosphate phosphatase UppP
MNIFPIKAIIHSVLESLPISSTWHMLYFFSEIGSEIHLLHLSLLPGLMALILYYQRVIPKNLLTIVIALIPTGCVYLLKKILVLESLKIPMNYVHMMMGSLLLGVAIKQMNINKNSMKISASKLLILIGCLQPLSLIVSGVSRLGTTLLAGLFYPIEFHTTIVLSFFLQFLLVLADSILDLTHGIYCSFELYVICSLVFLSSIHLLCRLRWIGVGLCGLYRIGLGILLTFGY